MTYPFPNSQSPNTQLLKTICSKTEPVNIQLCLQEKVYQPLWYILGVFRQDGHPVISLSHSVVARRLLRLLEILISLCPPASILLFQVSNWSTSGQKSYVYFPFFLVAYFCSKIELDALGQDGKLCKNNLFSLHSTFCYPNEWQNKITVGDAIPRQLAILSI